MNNDTALYFSSDQEFNNLLSEEMRLIARQQWTPLKVAKEAAGFLATTPQTKILDIGSGIGKFCLIGGHFFPNNLFYGIEIRSNLIHIAQNLQELLNSRNTNFQHISLDEISLNDYDAFYFYNSFYENIAPTGRIDEALPLSNQQYQYLSNLLFRKLQTLPAGTRLATYFTPGTYIPEDFIEVQTLIAGNLKFYVKV